MRGGDQLIKALANADSMARFKPLRCGAVISWHRVYFNNLAAWYGFKPLRCGAVISCQTLRHEVAALAASFKPLRCGAVIS